ncbi:class I SAM-dependent methyltransferase [Tepidiforma sp.]|uniref:class I SAM-dependent methyltransferase n=1 Tax=Tepidiforma sp. TaxID=2682230 RepID=UPI002ADE6BF2|nr:methyltransferase domain-containing protein [Tepidiforma sp.]
MDSAQIRKTYRWMAPIYDPLFARAYRPLRRSSIAALHLQPCDSVLLVGVGTGLDLPLLPPRATVIAIDLSPAMLKRARCARPSLAGHFLLADGGALPLRDRTVSAVILHLVLSVAPAPRAILAEAMRVLQPGGRIAVLDHFAPPGRWGLARQLLVRTPPSLLGTHLDRRVEELLAGLPLRVVRDRRLAGGFYRALVLVPAEGDDGASRTR